MRRAARLAALCAVALLSTGADAGPTATLVARIGTREVTSREFEARLASVPSFQLESLGRDEASAKRRVLEMTFIRDTLLLADAEARGISGKAPTEGLLRKTRANATLRAIRERMPPPSAIPKADLVRYYEAHRDRYVAPERIAVSRILAPTQADAEAVLAAFKADASYAAWEKLAKDKSLDKATSLRGGNLGFLAPDGSSSEAGVRAPVEVVKAASGVRDGEIVPTAIKEGEHFAVIWRRGTRAGSNRTFEQAEAEVRELVFRETLERASKELIDTLRKKHLSAIDESAFALAEPPPPDAVLLAEPKR